MDVQPLCIWNPVVLRLVISTYGRQYDCQTYYKLGYAVNNNNMVQLGEYIQIISPIIYGDALIVSILQFSAMKKSMSSQSVQ